MRTYLDHILAHKRQEIAGMYARYDLDHLRDSATVTDDRFYRNLRQVKDERRLGLIAEYKRRSPSVGAIREDAPVEAQVQAYLNAGAQAISVLTDHTFFGGSFDDLRAAALLAEPAGVAVLCKDFILDPIQVLLARHYGAHAVLLIAGVLDRQQLAALQQLAESLGMGVLVETHSLEDLALIEGMNFPVVGVNNRDLQTFRLSLNRANWIARALPPDTTRVAESGVTSRLDLRIATDGTDALLIGTGVMQSPALLADIQQPGPRPFFLKACGIRTPNLLAGTAADLIGLNFSPASKRRISPDALAGISLPINAVGVFFRNSPADIRDTLARHRFRFVQLYAEEVTPEFVASLDTQVLLAIRTGEGLSESQLLETAGQFAPHVYAFVLDGMIPGSGQPGGSIPPHFPWPFLLAGGINQHTLHRVLQYPHCIGVDTASGIETNGQVDPSLIQTLRTRLNELTNSSAYA